MRHIPQIKSMMTPFPYFVEVNDPLRNARETMNTHDIRHLPVMENHKLVGIITEHQITVRLGADYGCPSVDKLRVKDVFMEKAYTVELTEPLDNVLLHMARSHIGSVIVMKQGRLAGLYTVTDACKHFGEFLRDHFLPQGGNDAA